MSLHGNAMIGRKAKTTVDTVVIERMRIHMMLKGITQKELAITCHISESKVSQVLHGKRRMMLETYMRFCDAMNVPYDQLFRSEER